MSPSAPGSRARPLYQHFRSRLDLVDAICDTFAANPALLALRDAVELADADQALDRDHHQLRPLLVL